MYVLSKDKVLTILGGLCEGHSIRSLERQTGVNRNTIMSWLVRAGEACEAVSNRYLHDLTPKYVQADELHSFVGRKTTDPAYEFSLVNGYKGEVWVFVALDADTKLVISYLVGQRDTPTAYRILQDVRRRTVGTFQLTTDGHRMYRDSAELVFGSELHFGQLMKG